MNAEHETLRKLARKVKNADGMGDDWHPQHALREMNFHPVDAAYIAAASPDVILALLDRVEALEKALEPFADFPSAGVYGGPLCVVKGIYEDGTDENTARHRGRIDPSAFSTARSALRSGASS